MSKDTNMENVRELMRQTLAQTQLAGLIDNASALTDQGKMLRARLVLRIGHAAKTEADTLVRVGAAIELLHSGSLLHDDVIDGGQLRRCAPAFWTTHGSRGAILVGDLLFFLALQLVSETDAGDRIRRLIKEAGHVCEAESEQELLARKDPVSWENCVDIARRKTGSLFAFAAYAAVNGQTELRRALTESGYDIGTAYQLSDDILDATGNPSLSDKTLGQDVATDTPTTATQEGHRADRSLARLQELQKGSLDRLSPWPHIHAGWSTYLEQDMNPALADNLHGLYIA